MLNIIYHFSKFTWSYLVKRKTAKEVLYSLNKFIARYGIPKILKLDKRWKFSNCLLDDFCQLKRI